MSTQTPVVELEATNEELMEFIAAPNVDAPAVEPKKKRNVFYRLLALLFALAPAAVFYFLQVKVLAYDPTNGEYAVESYKLLDLFLGLFTKEGVAVSKLFGLLPLLTLSAQPFDMANGLLLYAIPASMAICVLAALVALFCGKAAPGAARFILFLEFLVYASYAICSILILILNYQGISACLDYVWIGLIGGTLLLYVILACAKSGKQALIGLIVFLLTTASAGALIYGIYKSSELTQTLISQYPLAKWILLGLVGLYLLSNFIAFLTIAAKKLYGADIARAVIMLLVGGVIVLACFLFKDLSDFLIYALIIAGASFVMLVFESIVVGVRNGKARRARKARKAALAAEKAEAQEKAVEEASAEVLPAPVAEEPVAAIAVTEPVAAIPELIVPVQEPVEEVAKEEPIIAPAAPAAPAIPVADIYGCGFDPFLATLTTEERTQFTHIFLLRSENKLPSIPDYVVGGDNKVFFRKVFVNLGCLRARIPDGLMEKIYQFTIRQ